MKEILDATNAVASQSDRWLFIFALLVLGCFAILVMKYFVKQHERLIDDHKVARDSYQASLINIVAAQAKTTGELGEIIKRNTEAMVENTNMLRRKT